MSDDRGLAARVYKRAHLTGTFTLRSGATSTEYFDKYRFEADPVMLREIAEVMATLVPAGAEVVAGLELGGVPLATMLSQVTGLPAAFVRKQAKTYGTCRLAEGAEVEGRQLVIIEDVITSGGQVVASAGDLRSLGATILRVLCVIDREQGGRERIAEAGLELASVFTWTDLDLSARSD
jgi:orotate phosphoribosyltransferase